MLFDAGTGLFSISTGGMSEMSDKYRGDEYDERTEEEYAEDLREHFEEKYGSTEDFSKRAVGSLFDNSADLAQDSTPLAQADEGAAYSPSAPRPPRGKEGGVASSAKWSPDPEVQYAKYLESVSEINRSDEARKQAEKERAIKLREEQLAELSAVVRKDRPSKSADGRAGGMPALNIRNIAAVAIVLVLVVFVVLITMLNSSRSDLAQAHDRIAELEGQMAEIVSTNQDLAAQLQTQGNQTSNVTLPGDGNGADTDTNNTYDDNGDDNGDADGNGQVTVTPSPSPSPTPPPAVANVPATTTNAAGQRIYTVTTPGDTFFAIATRFYGNGMRYPEILAANGLTAADVGNLHIGDELIIP